MWRYLAGGVAALLMIAAGWMLFSSRATTEPVLPGMPQSAPASSLGVPEDAEAAVPEASDRTREEKRFDRYDKNRDGGIYKEEYLASRQKAFGKLDSNGDGRLSFDEWSAKTVAKFTAADKDKSGVLDRAEFSTTAVKRKAKPRCSCPSPKTADDDN
ncbi:MAG: histidine kinase [Sphingomonas sp.]|jgi:hypothetical protein|nr:histidine kinase [Sphingomonas sp.]